LDKSQNQMQKKIVIDQIRKIVVDSRVEAVALSPDNRWIVSASKNSIDIWDANNRNHVMEIKAPSSGGRVDTFSSVAFSPEEPRIVSGQGNSVSIWDLNTGQEVTMRDQHTANVTSVAFSPLDGKRVVSGANDETVRVWDANTGDELMVLRGHEDSVKSVAFGPDGNRIASGSSDNSVRVWDANTGQQLAILRGHTDWVRSIAFSGDGTQIVSGSSDTTIRIWDANTGDELKVLQGHKDEVSSVVFAANKTWVVSGSRDATVRVWNVDTGDVEHDLKNHTGGVTSVAISADMTRIVSGSDDKTIRVWQKKPPLPRRALPPDWAPNPKYVEIHVANKGDGDEWDEIYQNVLDHSNDICRNPLVKISIDFIEDHLRFVADAIMVAYAPDALASAPDAATKYMNMYGFLIGNRTEYPGLFYVDLVCSSKPGVGEKLLEEATKYAKKQNLLGVKLAALPYVIGFYRKLGYRARETCFGQETDALRIAYDMHARPFVEKWGRDAINHITDTDTLASGYRSYLDLLISSKLAKDKKCQKIEDCNMDGYVMTKCFNDTQVGAGNLKRRKSRKAPKSIRKNRR